jgi:CRP-like cAMP-binding protein
MHCGEPGEYFYIVFKGKADVYILKHEEHLLKEREILANIERATS